MNLKINPSWLIIGSLIFGYISLYIPGIQIQYQIIESENKTMLIPPLEMKLAYVWGDKSGRDFLPCDFGDVNWDSNLLNFLFNGLRMVGMGIQMVTFWLWYQYADLLWKM